MFFRRSPAQAFPNLLEPLLVLFGWDHTQNSGGSRRGSIASRFSLHQDEFNVVLYHRVRFERFAQKARAVFNLVRGICDLVPDNRRQVVKPQTSTVLLDGGMQRNNRMSPVV